MCMYINLAFIADVILRNAFQNSLSLKIVPRVTRNNLYDCQYSCESKGYLKFKMFKCLEFCFC